MNSNPPRTPSTMSSHSRAPIHPSPPCPARTNLGSSTSSATITPSALSMPSQYFIPLDIPPPEPQLEVTGNRGLRKPFGILLLANFCVVIASFVLAVEQYSNWKSQQRFPPGASFVNSKGERTANPIVSEAYMTPFISLLVVHLLGAFYYFMDHRSLPFWKCGWTMRLGVGLVLVGCFFYFSLAGMIGLAPAPGSFRPAVSEAPTHVQHQPQQELKYYVEQKAFSPQLAPGLKWSGDVINMILGWMVVTDGFLYMMWLRHEKVRTETLKRQWMEHMWQLQGPQTNTELMGRKLWDGAQDSRSAAAVKVEEEEEEEEVVRGRLAQSREGWHDQEGREEVGRDARARRLTSVLVEMAQWGENEDEEEGEDEEDDESLVRVQRWKWDLTQGEPYILPAYGRGAPSGFL